MKKLLVFLMIAIIANASAQDNKTNSEFELFKVRFLDAFWKNYPSSSIMMGYGKYYEDLIIPDKTSFRNNISFCKQWLDSLRHTRYQTLNNNNRIAYNIIQNQLNSTIWEIDTFRIQEWDASRYNLGPECYTLITQAYAPLDERLRTLSMHLVHSVAFYNAALKNLTQPTKEHIELAITQNEGSLGIFGKLLTDSIAVSSLSAAEIATLQERITSTTTAIKNYVAALKRMVGDTNFQFRSFRIGEKLFNQKFQYNLSTNYTSKSIFDQAIAAKKTYHIEMYKLSNSLWKKYLNNTPKPSDSLLLIKSVIDKISLNHLAPANLFDTLNSQVYRLKHFIITKDLFDFDTSAPLYVRKMPPFSSGISTASANFPLPYQKVTAAYYNIADLSVMPPAVSESLLREYNNYILEILTIHEAVPGHCMQGIYNSRKSPDIIKSVFRNGAMAEGWAVYCQRMMLENGWGNDSAEMWLMFYKWSLRECINVIVDYGIHCLNYTKEDVLKLLKDEAFQEEAEVEKKYYRATVSQVQLCSYFTGATEILALRNEYRIALGSHYRLKEFHEEFLQYGTAPVKFIRQAMMKVRF